MIKLRSFSLTILFIPFVFCGQNQQTGKENGLGKLFKKIVFVFSFLVINLF